MVMWFEGKKYAANAVQTVNKYICFHCLLSRFRINIYIIFETRPGSLLTCDNYSKLLF